MHGVAAGPGRLGEGSVRAVHIGPLRDRRFWFRGPWRRKAMLFDATEQRRRGPCAPAGQAKGPRHCLRLGDERRDHRRSRLRCGVLKDLDARRPSGGEARGSAVLHCAPCGAGLLGRWLRSEGGRAGRPTATPLASRAEIDVHEGAAKLPAEPAAEKAGLARRRLEGALIVFRRREGKGRAFRALGACRAFHCAIVLRTALGRETCKELAHPVAQRLQDVERGRSAWRRGCRRGTVGRFLRGGPGRRAARSPEDCSY